MAITKIATVTVGSGGAASIDFTSIPGTMTDLMVQFSGRGTGDLKITFNGSSSGYTRRHLYGQGSSAGSSSGSDQYVGRSVPSANTANTFSSVQIYIPNYAGSTYKSYGSDSVDENNATTAYQIILAGLWSNTAAITSLSLSDYGGGGLLLAQYSSATLYGITKGSLAGVTVS
jgi:hypothetical protein